MKHLSLTNVEYIFIFIFFILVGKIKKKAE
jgi:hypothetical protein